MRSESRRRVLSRPGSLALFFAVAATACGGDSTPAEPAPTTGGIRVTSQTIGQDLDGDGYLVRVDNGLSVALPPNGSVQFSSVPAGTHDVRLDGVDANCTAGGGINRQVGVTAAQVSTVDFTITCVTRPGGGIPTVGTLEIAASTTGYELDRDGYRVIVNTSAGFTNSLIVPVNGTVSVTLASGVTYALTRQGMASNCQTDESESSNLVRLNAGETTTVRFDVACASPYPAKLPATGQLAFVRKGAIHLVNSDGTGVVALTNGTTDCSPAWSPDGSRIVFVRGCNTHRTEIYVMNADGSNLVRRNSVGFSMDPHWSPDGSKIIYSSGSILYLMDAHDITRPSEIIMAYEGWNAQPAWSPDGKSIAFVSDRSYTDGGADVFTIRLSDQVTTQLTRGFVSGSSVGLFFEPAWSPDGNWISLTRCFMEFLVCPTGTLMLLGTNGTPLQEIAEIRGMGNPSWSSDGFTIAFGVSDYIGWIRPFNGNERGTIVADGSQPAWRPVSVSQRMR